MDQNRLRPDPGRGHSRRRMAVIRTLGHKVVQLQPIHGFAAETSAAMVIQIASRWGIPVSTTHVISSSIIGVGATKRLSAVRWGVVERMLWTWVLTLPVTACLGFLIDYVARIIRVHI